MKKKLLGFSFFKNMAKFESFRQVVSSSINLLFVKSGYTATEIIPFTQTLMSIFNFRSRFSGQLSSLRHWLSDVVGDPKPRNLRGTTPKSRTRTHPTLNFSLKNPKISETRGARPLFDPRTRPRLLLPDYITTLAKLLGCQCQNEHYILSSAGFKFVLTLIALYGCAQCTTEPPTAQ